MEKVSFYTGTHIPYEVVRQLREQGAEAVRCQDVGLADVSDEEHLIYAAEHNHVLITCDHGFENIHWRWMSEGKEHSGILYCRMPELCTIKIILENALLIYTDPDGKSVMHNDVWRVKK